LSKKSALFKSEPLFLRCDASIFTSKFASGTEYTWASAATFNSNFKFDFDGSITAKFSGQEDQAKQKYGFSGKANVQYKINRDAESSSLIKSMDRGEAEVVSGTAQCFIFDVAVSSYARSRFTPEFILALLDINATLAKSPEEQFDAYSTFTKNFGTHFLRRAKLGASLSFHRVLNTLSGKGESERKRKNCLKSAMSSCLEGSGDVAGIIDSASGKACVNSDFNLCLGGNTTSSGSSQLTFERVT